MLSKHFQEKTRVSLFIQFAQIKDNLNRFSPFLQNFITLINIHCLIKKLTESIF